MTPKGIHGSHAPEHEHHNHICSCYHGEGSASSMGRPRDDGPQPPGCKPSTEDNLPAAQHLREVRCQVAGSH